ncbi:MAG: hypothetical protein ABH811_00335 [archaeon]
MKLINNKRGELTTQQIVGLIILIISFAVILFFIFRLNLGEITNKEICHNSVVLRDQSKYVSGPIDCRTSYVCISGGGKCDNMNPTITKKIDMKKTDNEEIKNEIMKAISDEMVDCWWMFGEGKVNYVKGITWEDVFGGNVCAICSIIRFDDKIQEGLRGESIDLEKLYNFMKTYPSKNDNKFYYLYRDLESNQDMEISFDKKYSILTGIAGINAKGKVGSALWDVIKAPLWITKVFKDEEEAKKEFPNEGPIPIRIFDDQKLEDFMCGEFITKA